MLKQALRDVINITVATKYLWQLQGQMKKKWLFAADKFKLAIPGKQKRTAPTKFARHTEFVGRLTRSR
jgi:hypothetical protein